MLTFETMEECACFPCLPCPHLASPGPRSGSAPSSAPAGSSSLGSSWRPQPLYDSSLALASLGHSVQGRSCPYWSLLSCLDSTLSFPSTPSSPPPPLVWTLFFMPLPSITADLPKGTGSPKLTFPPSIWSSPRHTVY